MSSINRSQPEDNYEDLSGPAALDRLREIVKQAPTCFFVTAVPTADTGGARPMGVREVDDDGNLWFLSPKDSHTNQELAINPAVRLYFQGSEHSDFLHLNGRATILVDRARIKELWSPLIETWFTGGVDDPRISIIKVTPTEGYYWDTKHGKGVAFSKMLIGAALKKTMDDSIQGKLEV
jgi:general stress protein 26